MYLGSRRTSSTLFCAVASLSASLIVARIAWTTLRQSIADWSVMELIMFAISPACLIMFAIIPARLIMFAISPARLFLRRRKIPHPNVLPPLRCD